MSDLTANTTATTAPPASDPAVDPSLISPDDITAQIEAIFAAQGVTPDTATPDAASPDTLSAATDAANAVLHGDANAAPEVDTGPPTPVDATGADATDATDASDAASAPTPTPSPTDDLIALSDGLVVNRDELAGLAKWYQDLTPAQMAAIERITADPSAASGSGYPAPVPAAAPQGYGQALPGAGYASPLPAPAGYPYQAPYPAPGQPGAYQYPAPAQNPYGQPYTPQGTPPAVIDPATAPPPPGVIDPRRALGALTELAPELADYLAVQQQQMALQAQQLNAYQAMQADLASRAAADEDARRQAALRAGHARFAADHPDFDERDLHYLASRAAEMQVIAPLVNRHNGDVTAAYAEALNTAMWADPHYRDRATQSQLDAFTATQQATNERRENAASLTGSTGSIPQVSQPDPAALTSAQRREALAAGIASAMQG